MSKPTPQNHHVVGDEIASWATVSHLMATNAANAAADEGNTNIATASDYVTEEIQLSKSKGGKGFDATEPYCDPKIIEKMCKQHLPRYHLPRLARVGNGMFGLTYKYTIIKGKFSMHHAWRLDTKNIFSLKLDKRDLDIVRKDQQVRSSLVGVDVPRVVHAERQGEYCLTIMEPLAVSLKWYMQYMMGKTKNPDLYYGMLLRIGRQCVQYLRAVHESGYLHGNINPHCFIFPYKRDGRPNYDRGPLLIDYACAINWKEDPIYMEQDPEKHRNNALFEKDGGMYTRRDDLENFGYLLLFLAKGYLRWESRTQRDTVMFGKKCVSDLNKYVRGMPLKIKHYLTYVRILRWNEEPDYDLLVQILGNKKVDIRKEIKIRRDRRLAEKKEQKRKKRVSDSSCNSPAAAPVVEDEPTQKKPRVSTEEQELKPEVPIVACRTQIPPEARASTALWLDDVDVEAEELPQCPYCAKQHENPTLDQWVNNVQSVSPTEYEEMLKHGKPDPCPHDEHTLGDGKCRKLGRTDSKGDRRDPEDEYDSDTSVLEDMLKKQKELPDRQLHGNGNGQVSWRQNRDIPIQLCFPFLDWETDPEQNHPWEDELSRACIDEQYPLFEYEALSYSEMGGNSELTDLCCNLFEFGKL